MVLILVNKNVLSDVHMHVTYAASFVEWLLCASLAAICVVISHGRRGKLRLALNTICAVAIAWVFAATHGPPPRGTYGP